MCGVALSTLTQILSPVRYTGANNFERGITMLKHRTAAQLFLLAVGIAMIGFGLWRGEADTVLSKAIRLCMAVSYTHLTLPTT